MRILIAGALGHIGSSLINHFLSHSNHEIIALDNLSTQRYCSLFELPNSTRFSFYDEDITSEGFNTSFKHVDVVVNLAALTDPELSFVEPDATIRHNLKIVSILARRCELEGIPLIHISSTSIFSANDIEITDENESEYIDPHTPYARSKWKEEKFIQEEARVNGLKYCILRFGTIYGFSTGMRFHTAVNKFCWQALTNKKITVWQTALNQKRPYLALVDGVSSICHVIEKNMFSCQSYNIVTDNYSVSEVIQEINNLGYGSDIEMIESKSMNNASFEVSSKKFIETGFQFSGHLSHSIQEIFSRFSVISKPDGR